MIAMQTNQDTTAEDDMDGWHVVFRVYGSREADYYIIAPSQSEALFKALDKFACETGCSEWLVYGSGRSIEIWK